MTRAPRSGTGGVAGQLRPSRVSRSRTSSARPFTDGTPGGPSGPLGDIFLYPHTQIDVQAIYTLPMGLAILFSGLNPDNQVFGFFTGSQQRNLQREFYGRTFAVGSRWNL